MRVLITGGHFSPAYSLIKELMARGDTVAIAGRKRVFENDDAESLEYKIAMREKIKFYEVKTGRFQRRLTAQTIPSILKIGKGFFSASSVIRDFKPDLILTFGGYVAFPVVYAAYFKRIPIVLHEQTPRAGLASRAISKVASRICISFETSRAYFPDNKTIFTGMPIREEIFTVDKTIPISNDKPVLYITGGSSGSHFINAIVGQVMDRLLDRFVVIHQTGDNDEFKDFETLSIKRGSLPQELKERYILRKFIFPDEIGYVFSRANIVVSRSGINTVLELLALGKPCFLIPLPHGQVGEQLYNAKLAAETGIGDYLEQRYVTANKFLDKVFGMLDDIGEYEKNKETAGHYIVTDAVARIIKVVDDVYATKTR